MPLGLEWTMRQARLIQSSLRAPHDSGTASQGVHARALLAQHHARCSRSRQNPRLCSLAAIAVSHVVMSSRGSAQRRRLHHVHRKSLRPVRSAPQSRSNSKEHVISQPSHHAVSNTGHIVLLRTASQSSKRPSGQSPSADPPLGQQGPVSVAHILPSRLSNSSPSQLPSAAPLPGQQCSLRPTQKSAGSYKGSVISWQFSSLSSSQQAPGCQLSTDSAVLNTSALQPIATASNAISDDQDFRLQTPWVCARQRRSDASIDEGPQKLTTECTLAADLPSAADQ